MAGSGFDEYGSETLMQTEPNCSDFAVAKQFLGQRYEAGQFFRIRNGLTIQKNTILVDPTSKFWDPDPNGKKPDPVSCYLTCFMTNTVFYLFSS